MKKALQVRFNFLFWWREPGPPKILHSKKNHKVSEFQIIGIPHSFG